MNGSEFSKSYAQFCFLVQAIKKRETPLILGVDYVCMSRKTYDKLVRQKTIIELLGIYTPKHWFKRFIYYIKNSFTAKSWEQE